MKKIKSILGLLIISFLCLSSSSIQTNIYYVATNGNDNNSGTISSPWATWQKAFSTAVAGDLVYIRGGVYKPAGARYGGVYTAAYGNKIGTSSNPIRIFAYPGETPILDGGNMTQNGERCGVYLSSSKYYHLKGLTIRYVTEYGQYDGCPTSKALTLESCENTTIENCVAYGCGRGFVANGTTDYTTFLNCDSYEHRDYADLGGYADGFGINLYGATRACHTTLIGCRAWGNSDDGYDCFASDGTYRGGYVTFDQCWAFNNGYPITSRGNGAGIKLGQSYGPKESGIQRTVTRCLIFGNRAIGLDESQDIASYMDMNIYNNTSYSNGSQGFLFSTTSGGGTRTFRNNISYNNGITINANGIYVHSNNTWDSNVTVNSSDFVSLVISQATAPRQSDGSLPIIDFLRLAQGSDLIDAGINVGLPYNGSAPDIGANEFTGSTPTPTIPTITTTSISNISVTTATSGGNVVSDGGSSVTSRGVCWSTTQNPTIANTKTSNGTGTGSFTSSITGLLANTTYYVRAYATNSIGTSYGSQISFTTNNTPTINLPTLTTTSITNITAITANSGGNITSDGGATVTARGVCWSILQNPTITNSKTTDGTGTGVFTSSITGLTGNTIYYVRAYATNSAGTAYGNQVLFESAHIPPTVSTAAVTNITTTSAVSGGNVILQGGENVTVKGVCWSTLPNPTIANSRTNDGTGLGSFVSNITGLSPSTTYHVRAYATNIIGTSYGSDIQFTTNNVPINPPTITTTNISNITSNSATGGGNITSDGGVTVTSRGVCWSTSQSPTIINSKTTDGTGIGSFTSSITGLSPNTTYYVRAYATNSVGTSYGSQTSFTTLIDLPTLTTTPITNITTTTANSGGNITSDGGGLITARGVCWSTFQNPTIVNSKTTDGTGSGTFTSSITGLSPNTTYYVRAYATNPIGTSYGEQVLFTTSVTLPSVTTTQITSITSTTAIGGGNVTSDGGSTVTVRGICWATTQNPTITNPKTTDGSGLGSFISSITGLSPNTTYYVRAYATNSVGTIYGSQVTFTTSINLPSLTTSLISNITTTTATGGGNITSDGGASVTVKGICWATTQNPTITNSKTTDGSGVGIFITNMTGLSLSTTYYVRAYATNSAGTSYGNQVSFTTLSDLPTLTTSPISNIATTTATSGGNITSDGGSNVTARGICWATTQNPTIANSKTINGTGIGSFISNITGLSLNTTYYVRSYATNSVGTSYGNQISFNTLANLPTLTTNSITNITSTTASGGGNITSDGGSNVTARGICWSTTQNPTTANTKTTDGIGTGSFVSLIIGLSPNITYYVRAYATNSVGTSYGNQISFTTVANLPTLTTSSISNITPTTATGGGNITSDGGTNITARGICWSTSPNPTITSSKTIDGSGTGVFTSSMTGLVGNTLYYVRAYATNSVGTSYGNEISFKSGSLIPTISTVPVADITYFGAVSGGNITSEGGENVTARGVCWNTLPNPTISNSHTNDGSGLGTFSSNIIGLLPSTTYYVRAYATNIIGTAYGNSIQFTTSDKPNTYIVTNNGFRIMNGSYVITNTK